MNAVTASEQIMDLFAAAWASVAALAPMELAINIGLSLVVLVAAWGGDQLAKHAVDRGMRALPGPPNTEKKVRTRRVAHVTWWALDIGLTLLAIFLLAAIWGFDLAGWLSRGLGEQLYASAVRIAVVAVLGFAALELAGLFINQLLGRLSRAATDARRAAQLSTLAPLLRGVAKTVIVVVAALMVLSETGIQIGPLLAGAGVVGVAVGFGAQTLVKDFLTGVFLVMEDIVAVGDVVTIGGFGGLVEEMTIRTIRLRDLDGTLHVFPYSEAQVIHNMTKAFSYYVFDLRITYESDADRAVEIMRATAAELRADPEYAERIIDDMEIMGVDKLGEDGLTLKARIKTLPVQQWSVGREYNRRIKLAFDAGGIELAAPRTRVVIEGGRDPGQAASSPAGGSR